MKKPLLLLPLLAVVAADVPPSASAQTGSQSQAPGARSQPRRTAVPGKPAAPKAPRLRIYVGTYTGGESESKGIYRLLFDPSTGSLALDGAPTETVSPSFLAFTKDGKRLFTVNETGNSATDPPGGVSSFSVDPATGALTLLSRNSSAGAAPCHLSLDRAEKHLLLANYWGGSVMSLILGADGKIGSAASYVRHAGDNPTPRDPGPHPHAVHVDPSSKWALVTDLGLDKVFVYPYDAERGALGPDPREVALEKGSGPRHLAFDPDGKGVFVLNELSGTVVSFGFDPADGSMVQLHTLSTLQQGYAGKNSSAEVVVSPDGRFVYASNRGPDNLAIFEIHRPSRQLRRVGYQPTLGKHPRNFAIDPSGEFLAVANRDSNSVIIFRVNQEAGTLSPVAGPARVPKPACVRFQKVGS